MPSPKTHLSRAPSPSWSSRPCSRAHARLRASLFISAGLLKTSPLEEGSLYPLLIAWKQEAGQRRVGHLGKQLPRRYYRLTAKGRKQLAEEKRTGTT